MDEILKNRLKELGLLPLELDAKAHYSPGTPPQVVDLYERINQTASRLYRMELIAQSGTTYYKMLEDCIKADLSSADHILMKEKNPPLTGTVGFSGDV
jgi:hypothetical protein